MVLGNILWGSGGEALISMSADSSGNIYALGFTTSQTSIATPGSYQTSYGGQMDGMIVKFSSCTLAPPTLFASDTSICSADTAFLTTPAVQGAGYLWARNNVAIAGATSNTFNAYLAGNYTVTIFDDDCMSVSAPVSIQVLSLPSAFVSGSPLTVCDGDTVTLTGPVSATLTYQWYQDNVVITGATNDVYPAMQSGTYLVETTSTITGCSKKTISPVLVTIKPMPLNSLTNLTPLKFCDGDSAILKAGTGLGYTYQWRRNNILQAGATDSLYSAKTTGSYKVKISLNGCHVTTDPLDVFNSDISIQATVTDAMCNNSQGSISVVPTGGVVPYTYSWNGSPVTASSLTDLEAGDYVVTVEDSIGCTHKDTITVNQSTDPMISDPVVELCAVSVDSISGKNLVIWEKNGWIRAVSYKVYKESAVSGQYTLLTTQPVASYSTYLDMSSTPLQQSHTYYITEIDSCGDESPASTLHKTMHLASNIGVNGEVNLIWNLYEGKSYTTHYIMRNDGAGFFQIAQVTATTTILFRPHPALRI
jgi:hypothetical protein